MIRCRDGFASVLGAGLALALGLVLWSGSAGAKDFLIGLQCDRSGPTQNVGPFICDGFQDYIKLFNSKHPVGSANSVKVEEIDHSYTVPKGMESYERFKADGALTIAVYGTPQTMALAPKLAEDKILGTSPGFGSAAAANGEKFPYLFPVAATYWSQATGSVKFVMDNWKDKTRKPRIAYLFYDNPAGREPLPVLEALQKELGFELKTWAVPPPGLEVSAQVLDITRQYKADWVVQHLFGVAPSVAIKQFAQVGYPRNRIVSFVWGASESDLNAAGWKVGEGYYALQFAGVGAKYPIIDEIKNMYKKEGKPEPKSMDISVYYNRGVFMGALHSRAIELAYKKKGDGITSQDVRDAMQTISKFSLGGLLPPLNLTPKDHEGGGWVQMTQVQNGKLVPVTKWYRGYPKVLERFVYGQG